VRTCDVLKEDEVAAYVIAHIDVKDPVRYQDYIKMSPISIAKFGGRFIARGGRTEVLEGNWVPKRLVLLEFPSVERAREWWASEEYAPAKALRQATSYGELVILDGV
jgi:uncharacterized protein (DUF1330 family)